MNSIAFDVLIKTSKSYRPQIPSPPLSLSSHLGALAGDLGCFPFDDKAYPPIVSLADFDLRFFGVISSIQSLPRFGTALAAHTKIVLYP